MAGAGYRDWVAGEKPTAVQFDTFLQHQTVMVFASAAARNAALAAVLAEGMFAIPIDTNALTVYSGAAWSTTGPLYGALLTWTPTWTQGATITKTINSATYSRVGRQITANFNMTATSAGTASNSILFGLPVTSLNVGAIGVVVIFDASGSTFVPGLAYATSTTQFGSLLTTGDGATGVRVAPTIASGDIASATISFEAAADG